MRGLLQPMHGQLQSTYGLLHVVTDAWAAIVPEWAVITAVSAVTVAVGILLLSFCSEIFKLSCSARNIKKNYSACVSIIYANSRECTSFRIIIRNQHDTFSIHANALKGPYCAYSRFP